MSLVNKHDNIVKLYNYSESQDEIHLYMEKVNDPGYFERKLE